MSAVLAIHGFGGRNTTRDRITITSGTPGYDTSNLPPGSRSSTSFGGSGSRVLIPWYDDVNGGSLVPATDELWYHFRYYTEANNTNNNTLRAGLAHGSTELFAVSAQDNTNLLTLRIGGVLVATASTNALSVGTWARVHVHIAGQGAGDHILVYVNGDLSNPIIDYTMLSADVTALGAVQPDSTLLWTKSGAGPDRFDDVVVFDPSDAAFPGIQFFASCDIKEQVFTGNGPGGGGGGSWSGSYTDIDERPASDSDKIVAISTGLISDFTKPAVGVDNVFAVKMLARVTRTGTAGGANLTLRSNDGTNHEDAVVPAPGDGDVQHIFQQAPDGLPWSPVKYDATRFGFVSTP